jgi:methyl-accepting chemotaxis protein
MSWVKQGARGNEPNPELGPDAYVRGMLGRLQKLGLGNQVYVQSAAMEPELDALHVFFEKRQELSQFIVGLMVGLGLLGTFIGLLETLVATSTLIGTIANSVGGSGGNMESEFARIVGGLQKPLAAMGTAFSASVFGLVGSIMLGFQMIIVRRTVAAFVELAREEVLSIAEKSKTNTEVEITERFLATLLADILEQHKETVSKLDNVANQLVTLIPKVEATAMSSNELSQRVQAQEEVLARTTTAVGSVRDVIPILSELAEASSGVFKESREASGRVGQMLAFLPEQSRMLHQVEQALQQVDALTKEVQAIKSTNEDVLSQVREHTATARRVDALLLSADKAAMRQALESDK